MNLIKARKKGQGAIEMEGTRFMLLEEQADHARKIDNADILVGIRPEKILPEAGRPDRRAEMNPEDGGRIALSGKISTVEPLGRETLYHVDLEECRVLALSDKIDGQRGDAIRLSFELKDIHLFDPVAL